MSLTLLALAFAGDPDPVWTALREQLEQEAAAVEPPEVEEPPPVEEPAEPEPVEPDPDDAAEVED